MVLNLHHIFLISFSKFFVLPFSSLSLMLTLTCDTTSIAQWLAALSGYMTPGVPRRAIDIFTFNISHVNSCDSP